MMLEHPASGAGRDRELAGVVPVLLTPFEPDGQIDWAGLEREARFLVESGFGWLAVGAGSEVHRLDQEEVAAYISLLVGVGAGQARVIAGVEVTSVRAGVAAVRRAQRAGAEVAMLRCGRLEGVNQDELFEAFRQVAEQGGLPVVVQDLPGLSGVELAPATLARLLSEVPGVIAAKIEPAAPAPKITQVMALLGDTGGTVLGGAGGADFVHELDRGARGTMPGAAFPEVFVRLQSLHAAGDGAGARRLMATLLPLMTLSARSFETFLFVQKYVLVRRGIFTTTFLRSPHGLVEAARVSDEIEALIAASELWDVVVGAASLPTGSGAVKGHGGDG
jgi:4-hydroxy-tetrahydrodipicolinate synthase